MSCACHWATNAAAGERAGQLVTTAYSVAPCAILVPPESAIGFLVTGPEASKGDIDKYLAALRRAQMEIDLRPELFKHYHLRSVPEKYRDQVDVRAFGTGERIVFLPYTSENFDATRQWTEAHNLFSGVRTAGYDEAALV